MALTAYHAAKQPEQPKPERSARPTPSPASPVARPQAPVARTPASQPGPRRGAQPNPRPVSDRSNRGGPAAGSRDRARRDGDDHRRGSGPRRIRPPKTRMEQKPETPGISLKPATLAPREYHAPLKKLRVIPLGGLGEVGMNMTCFEYGNDMILVDAGGLFPSERMPGIDLVIPDITYVLENSHKLRAMFLTHGHEDHIAGLPYILPRLPEVPVYALPLTKALVEAKFKEFNIQRSLTLVRTGQTYTHGVFTVDLFNLTHTIADTMGLAIHTPEGLVAYTTDWKFDHTPITGAPSDYAKLIQMSEEGVLLHMNDSTNAEIPGYTISERVVEMDIEQIFQDHPDGRVIMSMFSSSINRIQMAINLAAKYGRKIAVSGRSMDRNVGICLELGYVKAPKDILVDIKSIGNMPDRKLAIIATGSQGEEYSALVRMASGEHRQVKIKKGDTVIISASRIPGNEGAIDETIDNLFRQGADVVYGGELDIHTSGHAKQEELKMMIAMLKPKYLMPLHGAYRMLKAHAKLGLEVGVEGKNIYVGENGSVLEIEQGKASWGKKVPADYVMIDGLGIGDVGQIVLRDRQAMAEEGIFMVILTVDRRKGTLISSPDIISRGFVYMRDARDLISKARYEVKKLFDRHSQSKPMDWEYVKRELRDDLSKFLYEYTQRQPMVIPVVIEV
ncbi:RNase J family beta-CASP ribonuclease [Candidatus Berkelbacteria bacterium]|nr:RNase J family beta-CASP ribonuclease [Candidatus Berkelbacteria bacterium]